MYSSTTPSLQDTSYGNLSRTFRSNMFPYMDMDYTTNNESTYTPPTPYPVDQPNASIKRDDHLVEWNKKESVRKSLMKEYDKMLGKDI